MSVSKEELLYIAKLAKIKIADNEVDEYLKNLEDILNFANIINKADTDGINETIGSDMKNVFRKDEIVDFKDKDLLLGCSSNLERNMYKIPKVIN